MKYCSTCGKELQDDMQFCPSCGTPVQMSADEPKLDETFFAEEPTPKKKHKGIVAIIIVLVILAGAAFLYSNVATVNTYNKFAELYNTMAEGAGKAETANILITDVWRNSIFQTADAPEGWVEVPIEASLTEAPDATTAGELAALLLGNSRRSLTEERNLPMQGVQLSFLDIAKQG